MKLLWLTLLVLSPAILYAFALFAAAVYRRRCGKCGRRGLRYVGSYIWDGVSEDGRRCGGGVIFYLCEKCGARFKNSGRDWTVPSAEEWNRHASKAVRCQRAPAL
jgi:hypothetical protein